MLPLLSLMDSREATTHLGIVDIKLLDESRLERSKGAFTE